MTTSSRTFVLAMAVAFMLSPVAGRAADTTSAPTPAIYDTLANTQAQIDSAIARSRDTHRNVLIQWGANWCIWCRLLHGMLTTDSALSAMLDSNYVWVLADVGVKGKNAELLAKYGVDRARGIPFLTVLDSGGKVIANQETGGLETGDKEVKGHDRSKVLAFLNSHTPAPPRGGRP
ncbi:MAG: thioredoxin family protein [Candidatus Zixiibacteriota bacterium]